MISYLRTRASIIIGSWLNAQVEEREEKRAGSLQLA
jgi:hypothetical protein